MAKAGPLDCERLTNVNMFSSLRQLEDVNGGRVSSAAAISKAKGNSRRRPARTLYPRAGRRAMEAEMLVNSRPD